jgi:hypothetical protein
MPAHYSDDARFSIVDGTIVLKEKENLAEYDDRAREQKYLDEIHIAEVYLRSYRLIQTLTIAGSVLFFLMFLCGVVIGAWGSIIHIDTGALAAAIAMPSGIMTAVLTICSLTWFCHNCLNRYGNEYFSPKMKLMQARQNYSNFMLRKNND